MLTLIQLFTYDAVGGTNFANGYYNFSPTMQSGERPLRTDNELVQYRLCKFLCYENGGYRVGKNCAAEKLLRACQKIQPWLSGKVLDRPIWQLAQQKFLYLT